MTIPNELRPLLERIVKADASIGASSIELVDGWKAMAELRTVLAQPAAHADTQDGADLMAQRSQLVQDANLTPAAGGEAVEVVGAAELDLSAAFKRADKEMRLASCGRDIFYFALIQCLIDNPLMAVAQHQRIVAALSAENERLKREAKNDAIAYKAAIERQDEIRAEVRALIAERDYLRQQLAERDALLRDASEALYRIDTEYGAMRWSGMVDEVSQGAEVMRRIDALLSASAEPGDSHD